MAQGFKIGLGIAGAFVVVNVIAGIATLELYHHQTT